jgi:hypothetical protein
MKRRMTLAMATSMMVPAMGALALTLVSAPGAQAQCGGVYVPKAHPAAWQMQYGGAKLLRAGYEDGPSIVGLWHVKFISDGVSSGVPGGVPKGAEVDAGYSEWNPGGTEIMNSGVHAPNTSSFCLGTWEKVGTREYKLNHFAIPWDPTKGALDSAGNPVGELIGPVQIKETVTLAANGESFEGSFTIDPYDEAGHHLAHLEGTIIGTRIDVNTSPTSIF